jgi:hypothetical protein
MEIFWYKYCCYIYCIQCDYMLYSYEVAKEIFCVFVLFCFFSGTGVWTKGCTLTKWVQLSHTSSPFCSGCFGDGVLRTICSGWPQTAILLILRISASQVARIIGMSHKLWLSSHYIAQTDLELTILLFQLPECWDCSYEPWCLATEVVQDLLSES